MQDFPPGQGPPYPALKVILGAGLQLLGGIGRVEPGEGKDSGIVRCHNMGEHPPSLDPPVGVPLQYGGLDAAVHVKGSRHHRIGFGVVDIPPGIMEQQVPDGMDAQFGKLFGKGRANAFEVLNVAVQIRHGPASFLRRK